MDPYIILGVDVSDSLEVIRSAYLKKARLCHPDKTRNVSAREFLLVHQAWTMIKSNIESPDHVKSVNSGVVSFYDLQPRDDGLVYGCRCGDVFEARLYPLILIVIIYNIRFAMMISKMASTHFSAVVVLYTFLSMVFRTFLIPKCKYKFSCK